MVIITLEQAELMNTNFTELKTNVDSMEVTTQQSTQRMDSLKTVFLNFKQDSVIQHVTYVRTENQKLHIHDNVIKVAIIAGTLLTGYKMITTP